MAQGAGQPDHFLLVTAGKRRHFIGQGVLVEQGGDADPEACAAFAQAKSQSCFAIQSCSAI